MHKYQSQPNVVVINGSELKEGSLPVRLAGNDLIIDAASQFGQAIILACKGDYDLVLMNPIMNGIMRSYLHVLFNALGFIPARIDLAMTEATVEVREDLEDIKLGVERALAFSKRIDDLSMRDKPLLESVDINLVLNATIDGQFLPGRIQLFQELMPASLEILADRVLLEEALSNVIVNALEAMESSASSELRIGSRLADDRTIEVWVSDTGCGILPENVGQIFDRHYSTKSDKLGVRRGIGLWFCKKVVQDLHEGRIFVISEPGMGTTISMQFPPGAQ